MQHALMWWGDKIIRKSSYNFTCNIRIYKVSFVTLGWPYWSQLLYVTVTLGWPYWAQLICNRQIEKVLSYIKLDKMSKPWYLWSCQFTQTSVGHICTLKTCKMVAFDFTSKYSIKYVTVVMFITLHRDPTYCRL